MKTKKISLPQTPRGNMKGSKIEFDKRITTRENSAMLSIIIENISKQINHSYYSLRRLHRLEIFDYRLDEIRKTINKKLFITYGYNVICNITVKVDCNIYTTTPEDDNQSKLSI